ncbi:MAG: hypothetical protein FWG64_12020 [Firmicutes bacterium]|nr:hypothetical protein [Bacillota bacterium]
MEMLQEYLSEIEELLEQGKGGLFRNSVDKDAIMTVIENIRLNLPDEIKQAQNIKDKVEDILSNAKIKAEKIVEQAEIQAQALTEEHEIYLRASEHATETLEYANRTALDYNQQIAQHADEILIKADKQVQRVINGVTEQAEVTTAYIQEAADTVILRIQEAIDALTAQTEATTSYLEGLRTVIYENRKDLRN